MADNSALEANKALVRRSFEAIWSQGNLAVADEILSSDYVGHIATLPEPVRGVEAFKQLVAMYHFSFPDTRFEIQDQIAEGHKVASRWIACGTHRGEFLGIAPSGHAMSVTGMSFHRLDDGRIQESWDDWDALSILQGMTGDVFQSLSFHI